MKKINLLLAFFCFFFTNFYVTGQDLIRCKLTDREKKNKVAYSYVYNASEHYGVIKLSLYKSGLFYYTLSSFNRDVFSEGKWIRKKDTIILVSNIRNGHIPIKLNYSNDTSNLINKFRVGIVKNLKGEYLTDGLVNINNDSIKCVPEGGFCTAVYQSIDSIKVVFENGLSSGWVRVDNKDSWLILPIVQTNFLISAYVSLENRKYRVLKSSLKPID
jgi:hypothetical protein